MSDVGRCEIYHWRLPLPYLRGRENQTASWVILCERDMDDGLVTVNCTVIVQSPNDAEMPITVATQQPCFQKWASLNDRALVPEKVIQTLLQLGRWDAEGQGPTWISSQDVHSRAVASVRFSSTRRPLVLYRHRHRNSSRIWRGWSLWPLW